MTSPRITPLVMCGGTGTRLWPASREGRPKQFLLLFGPHSTFQETVRRIADPALFDRPIVVTSAQYRFLVAEQLAEIGVDADVLLEPARRESGPAVAAGAVFARRGGADPVLLALAADHVVLDDSGFVAACRSALDAAAGGRIVAFGVRPDRPATEYGYIRPGGASAAVFDIERFVEKPDAATAERYVADGYLWNSGNFLFRASSFLDEYAAFEPDSIAAVTAAVAEAGSDLGFVTLAEAPFTRAHAISVDYAVMERTKRGAVMPISYQWSDVGSWGAVWDLSAKDAASNAAQGPAVFVDSTGCFVASDRALAALFGVDDLIVVASEDALLVARRGSTLDMKRLVQKLKSVAPKVTEDHVKLHRPWGAYQSLDDGPRYQVKRIVVKPGGKLSLQKHMHRAEHWVVVRGTAEVTLGDAKRMVQENESVYIPIGAVHRLANPGKIPLELIEVQTGSYLGEDDIIRLDDVYHRS